MYGRGPHRSELAALIRGQELLPKESARSLRVLKHFYFGGASIGLTSAEHVQLALGQLARRIRRARTLIHSTIHLSALNSTRRRVFLHDLGPQAAAGGGYFLNLGGYGVVVDPGHGYLDNFYKLKRSL